MQKLAAEKNIAAAIKETKKLVAKKYTDNQNDRLSKKEIDGTEKEDEAVEVLLLERRKSIKEKKDKREEEEQQF